jgi:K+-sensing histidine kinase KdpD
MKILSKILNKISTKKNKDMNERVENLISYSIHGIREPIDSCLFVLEKLNKEIYRDEINIPQIIKNVKLLESLINNTNDVTQNFLDIYKNKSSKVYINRKPVDVINSVKETFLKYKTIYETENIKYTIDIELDEKMMNLDENKLKQILNNVYDNAISNTKEGIIHTHLYFKDNKFFIEISDSGQGIDECVDYFNLNDDTKFGLHISKFLAMKMMGNVSLSNKKDKHGAVFKCWFYNIKEDNDISYDG